MAKILDPVIPAFVLCLATARAVIEAESESSSLSGSEYILDQCALVVVYTNFDKYLRKCNSACMMIKFIRIGACFQVLVKLLI